MKDLAKSIFTILRYAGKTLSIIRNTLLNTLFIIAIIVLVSFFFAKEEDQTAQERALLLTIAGDIVEQKQVIDPLTEIFNEALGFSSLPEETLLQDIIDAIRHAADDQMINSLILDMSRMERGSLDQIHDIGEALEYFKLSGKPVVAAEDIYTQSKYLLASYADSIYLNPIGVVDLHGFGVYRLYFQEALEKLKVNYHVFRIGTYKSALEPITRNSMSEEAKQQNNLWLGALWHEYRKEIVQRRSLSQSVIDRYTNDLASLLAETGGDTAQAALATGLVDDLKSRAQLRTILAEIAGPSGDGGFLYTDFKEYMKTVPRSYQQEDNGGSGIGIIVANGNILGGNQPPGAIGSETMVSLLRQARNDHTIKAVVLRINSGGGSVFASEIIRRELLELKKSGKPYVVSMASVAASGGYWIAAQADEIFAYPTTLTGSIGIFGAIPTFEDSLAHFGVRSDGTGTTAIATGFNLTQPLSPEIKKAVQLGIEYGYRQFLSIVAEGRQMSSDRLEDVAEGRVFDGRTAQKLGLVDELGNLEDAIAAAAQLAGADSFSARYIKPPLSWSEKLLKQLQGEVHGRLSFIPFGKKLAAQLNVFSQAAEELVLFDDPKGIYAHCLINYY